MGGERKKKITIKQPAIERTYAETLKNHKKSNKKTVKHKKKLPAADIQLQKLANVYYIKTRNH